MASFKQAGRLIQFSSPAGQDVLLANSMDGVEGVSRLYSFDVELLATHDVTIDPMTLVGNKATLSLELLGAKGSRYFNGLVASFEHNPGFDGFDSYTARLVPSLWQLTLATNCRTFQNKTVMEIIKEVISPYALSVGDVTTFSYKPLDYATQFNETDFNFISRLAEQFGIFYWFEHTASDNKVIFGDSTSAYGTVPVLSEFRYVPKDRTSESIFANRVSDIRTSSTMITGKHTAYNYDFRTAQLNKTPSTSSGQPSGKNAIERYSWPSGDAGFTKLTDKQVGTPDHAAPIVTAKGNSHDVHAQIFHGSSDARSLTPGYTFSLTDHPKDDWSRLYYLSEVAHRVVQSPAYGEEGTSESDPYSNRFVAIQSDRVYRPENRTPKPKMIGPQNAIVVTPDGEDNYIDKYGRVNVRMLWDRTTSAHGTDNTWVRVAQPWAGPKTGAYFWPRLGDEVLIQFVEGDPDDPILMGSVYNASAMPKYALPDMSTRTGIFTRSLKAGGADNANELRFEDKAGSEQIFINAEKDLDLMVENDRRTHVKGQDSLIVDKDQLETITGNYNRQIKGNQVEAITGTQDIAVTGAVSQKYSAAHGVDVGGDSLSKIGGKQGVKVAGAVSHEYDDSLSLKIGMNHGEKVGMNYAVDAGMGAYLKAGISMVLEAGVELTLKAGAGFITIGPTGVMISGPMVMINSGGAAGAGSPPTIVPPDAPTAPAAPKDPDKADDGTKGGKM